jgi:hypothetical protein
VYRNTDELWESLLLSKFPNTHKEHIAEAKVTASIAWLFGDKTQMAEVYDQYVMMKRLTDVQPKEED